MRLLRLAYIQVHRDLEQIQTGPSSGLTFLNCMISFCVSVLVHNFASTLSCLKLKSYGGMMSLFPSTTCAQAFVSDHCWDLLSAAKQPSDSG